MKQTAVEWLVSEMLKPNLSMKEILKQAKKLEKQQIIDANNRGYEVGRKDIAENAQDYYNEKFKNK